MKEENYQNRSQLKISLEIKSKLKIQQASILLKTSFKTFCFKN